DLICINNRDLNTLKVNLNTTIEMIKDIPDSKIIVSESGINTRDNVKVIESTKVDAILVGTSFMKAKDIGAKIDELLGK
ncbi:MAG: indole-3-glycerol-phosphate synthase TrpC, partial [Thermodesulfovibrionia bacterium]|nr:indole-3-glycerol-phosphate synthase TrpC [Thermodesulfovibrionia bacterium]